MTRLDRQLAFVLDEQAARILPSVHRAMPPYAKLALFQAMVPEDDAKSRDARMKHGHQYDGLLRRQGS